MTKNELKTFEEYTIVIKSKIYEARKIKSEDPERFKKLIKSARSLLTEAGYKFNIIPLK